MSYADRQPPEPVAAASTLDVRIAAHAADAERAAFVTRTYAHLAGAIFALVALEVALFQIPGIDRLAGWAFQGWNWLLFLGGFMAVGWVADRWARSDQPAGMQYLGLGLYVVAEAVLLLPLLLLALVVGGLPVVGTAAVITLSVFTGLTGVVVISGKDFSFLRGGLSIVMFAALGLIVCSILFGFELGALFSGVMVMAAGGYVLYYTSGVMEHYRTDQHVAASLALFAAIALLFWYVLRLVLAFSSSD